MFASAVAGEQWGTITSEPGSGGDIARTRAVAAPLDARAVPARPHLRRHRRQALRQRLGHHRPHDDDRGPRGRGRPDDLRARRARPAVGRQRRAQADRRVGRHGDGGHPEPRHAPRGAPAVRLAWNGPLDPITRAAGPFIATLFTAVVLGVLDEAVGLARDAAARQGRPAAGLRAGRVVAGRAGPLGRGPGLRGRAAGRRGRRPARRLPRRAAGQAGRRRAGRARRCCRLTRVLGGGTFSQRSPFAHWFEDVRALGFLRPPWGLAYDTLFVSSFD